MPIVVKDPKYARDPKLFDPLKPIRPHSFAQFTVFISFGVIPVIFRLTGIIVEIKIVQFDKICLETGVARCNLSVFKVLIDIIEFKADLVAIWVLF